jgi:hypothetical protein
MKTVTTERSELVNAIEKTSKSVTKRNNQPREASNYSYYLITGIIVQTTMKTVTKRNKRGLPPIPLKGRGREEAKSMVPL